MEPKGLHNLHRAKGSKRGKTRVGRGNGSGIGTYSGRGIKGQRARAGGRTGTIARAMKQYLLRIPKTRGFASGRRAYLVVSTNQLHQNFKDGESVTPKTLRMKGLTSDPSGKVKILAEGTLSKKLTVAAHAYSVAAKEQIEKAGVTTSIIINRERQVVPVKPTKQS